MKVVHRFIGIALLSLLTVSPAWAQPTPASNNGPTTSPSDRAAVPPAPQPQTLVIEEADETPAKADGEGCGCAKTNAGLACPGDACGGVAGQPWTMPQPALLQRMGFRMGGWVEQGFTFNADNPADGFNGPLATNDHDDTYQLNQFWLWLHRPADNGGYGWAVGGHVDMIFGSDWRFGINNGLETRINGFNGQDYGLVIPQAYAEVAYNRLSVKLGHMAAILDYEAVPSIANPFYSHSYSYGYTVPQLVTGVLADYKATENFSVQAGLHRGWQQFEDNNDSLDFMGGVKWTSPDKSSSIAWAMSVGPQDAAGDQDRLVSSLVWQQQLTERLKYVLVQNLGWENGVLGAQDAEWYGVNQYLLYRLNQCWSLNLRGEWLRDDDGARVAGPGNIPGVDAFSGRGFVGNFFEITAGAGWQPHPNLLVRPEVRYDWFDGVPGPTGLPFNAGTKDTQLTFAVDAVITF